MVLSLGLFGILSSCSKNAQSKINYQYYAASKVKEQNIAAEYGTVKITNKELMDGIYADVFDLEKKIFDLKMNRLKAVMLKKLIESDPKKKNLTNDQFLDKYIAKSISVSNKDIQKFIKQRKIPKEQITDMVKGQIKKFLEVEKKKEAVERWMAEKTSKTPVKIYFPRPTRPTFEVKVTEKDPSWGNKDAKVTIVEFSDFQCPFCSKAAKVMEQVKKHYGKKVRIVFKNFPLPFHPQAKGAAMAALCANEQGATYFWGMYRHFFENQSALDADSISKYAKNIGLNIEKFNQCIKQKKFKSKLDDDMKQAGEDLSIKSTPTFYINGQLVNGALPFETFKEIIDEQLAQ
jgi:protein-disulfide isomerase